MKVAEILESVPALNKIMASPMPPRLAFRLGRLMAELNKVLEDYERTRLSLIKQFAAKGRIEAGRIAEAHTPEFMALMQPVLMDDVPVAVPVILLSDLDPSLAITPADMLKLHWLIRDEEPVLAR